MKKFMKFTLALLSAAAAMSGCAGKNGGGAGTAVSDVENASGENMAAVTPGTEMADVELAPAEGGVTFTDDLGRSVTVKDYGRVVAMTGSLADIWMLSGGEVAGASNDAWANSAVNLGEDVVNIGAHTEPDIEKIIAAKPDFIIASANIEANVEMEKILSDAGIATAYFDVSNFGDYLNMMEICTGITGRKDLLEKNGYAVMSEIEAVKERAAKKLLDGAQAPRIVFLRASAANIKVKGGSGIVGSEILADLGCVNIADDDNGMLEDLSMEAIIAADPDFIFVTTHGTDTEAVKKYIEDALEGNPAWSSLTAVKEGRYFMLEKELYNLKPNARWGEAYRKLADMLYGTGEGTDSQ